MPAVLNDPHIDTVVAFLRSQSGEVTLSQLCRQFSPALPKRTVQRLVTNLTAIGLLTTVGGSRTSRYALRTKPGPLGTAGWVRPDCELGAAICAAVPAPERAPARPRQLRAPRNRVAATPAPAPATFPPEPVAVPAKSPPPSPAAVPTRPARILPRPPDVVPQVAVRPAPPPPASATPSADAFRRSLAYPMSPRFSEVFMASVSNVVRYSADRSRAETTLRVDAAIAGLTPPQMEKYIPAALGNLDALTAEQAAHCGVTAGAYANWRAFYPMPG